MDGHFQTADAMTRKNLGALQAKTEVLKLSLGRENCSCLQSFESFRYAYKCSNLPACQYPKRKKSAPTD